METLDTDLVIIGAGLAGLCAALTAQDKIRRILLLSKNELFTSGSSFRNLNGRWGITHAANDVEKERLLATINTLSKGTNNPALSQILVEESHQAFLRLNDWGVRFTHHHPGGKLLRVIPCFADTPLAAIIKDTHQCAEILSRRLDRNIVTCLPDIQAQSIETNQNGFTGVFTTHQHKTLHIKAQAAILATGGNAATFQQHIVDPGLTGDGYKILQELDLPLKNMQFSQMAWEEMDRSLRPRFPVNAFFDGDHLFRNIQGEIITLPATPPTCPNQQPAG